MRIHKALVSKFFLLLALTFGMYVLLRPIEHSLIRPITEVSALVLSLLGYSVTIINATLIVRDIIHIEIIGACTPLLPFLLLVSYVLLFGRGDVKDIFFLCMGFIFLFIVDVLRIIIIVILATGGISIDSAHQIVSYLLVPLAYVPLLWIYSRFRKGVFKSIDR